jgi:hypothetical protein
MRIQTFSLAPAGIAFVSLAFLTAPPEDCSFVQGMVHVSGFCFEQATGCGDCCRHDDQSMNVPVCQGGNQFAFKFEFEKPFMAKVNYCPGTAPNECTYAATVACGHFADACTVDDPCEIPN